MNTDTPRTDDSDTPTFIDKTIDNYNNELIKACLREQQALKQLNDVRAERDASRAEISHMVSENGNMYLEIFCARNQRDRLAEALKRIVTIYENPEKGCIPSSSDMYDVAIQSLTPNAKP